MKFKKIAALFAACFMSAVTAPSFASHKVDISGYEGLVNALRNGYTVHAVIDVDKCKYIKGSNDWNEKTLGFRIEDIYERVAADLVTGKKMRLIASSWHDYVGNEKEAYISRALLRVFENGSVEVIGQSFSMPQGKMIDMSAMSCRLSKDGSGGVNLIYRAHGPAGG